MSCGKFPSLRSSRKIFPIESEENSSSSSKSILSSCIHSLESSLSMDQSNSINSNQESIENDSNESIDDNNNIGNDHDDGDNNNKIDSLNNQMEDNLIIQNNDEEEKHISIENKTSNQNDIEQVITIGDSNDKESSAITPPSASNSDGEESKMEDLNEKERTTEESIKENSISEESNKTVLQEGEESTQESQRNLEIKTPPLPPLTPSSSQNSSLSQMEGKGGSNNEEKLLDAKDDIITDQKEVSLETNQVEKVKKKKKKKGASGENRLSFESSALAAIIPRVNSQDATGLLNSPSNTGSGTMRGTPSHELGHNRSESLSKSRKTGTISGGDEGKFFDVIMKGDSDALNRLIHDNKRFMDLRSKDSMNPLHFAAFHGQLEALQLMLKGKNELVLRDSHGNTPLHSAVTRDHSDIVSFLTRTEPSLVWEVDQDGDNAIHLASSLGSIKSLESIVQILGRETVAQRIGERNSNGKNCLHLAASLQDGKTVNYLLKNFPDQLPVNQEDGVDQKVPLHYAAAAGSLASATELIEFGAQPNAKDKSGDTPLHIAARTAPESLVALLIRKGATVGALNNQQKTPMHLATEEGKDEVCYILTTNGADVSIRYQWAGRKKVNNNTNEELQKASQADRWGYMPSEKNQGKKGSSGSSNTTYLAKLEAKQIEKERERSQKWAVMVSNWDDYMSKKEKQFKKRLIKGLPDCLRGPIWRKLIGCDLLESKNVGKYQELLSQSSTWVEQIDLDINRSARNHVQFKDRFGSGQVALFNVLKAYSVYDKEVGYCQGMSDMAAFLLMHVLEEDTFWILVELCSNSKYDLHGRFLSGFPLLKQSFWIWEKIFEENLPKLFNHFNNQDTPVSTTFYATKWFLTVFLDAFPFRITVRLWDLFLYCGYDVVYTITFAIMKWFEKKLMVCSFDEILGLFRSFEEMYDIDPDEFISFIMKHEIKAAKIRKLEAEYKVLKDSGKEDMDFVQAERKNKDKKSKK